MDTVHISPYAGSWYPGRPAELERLLAELWRRSLERTGAWALRDPLAFVVPHAGLVYSGAVAAAAYRMIAAGRPARIVLLGFSHRGGPDGVAIPRAGRIATPAGEVPVDGETAAALAGSPPFEWVPEHTVCDHSVEIQMPLLARAAPGVPVLPLYVGKLDAASREAAARGLAALAGPGTIFLASSDFTHYGREFRYQPFPPGERLRERLRELDFAAMEAAGSLDPGIFLDHLSATGATVCGHAPVALLAATLRLLGDDIYQESLDYQTSAEITGDTQHSVSYAALGYFRARSFELEREDRERLLDSAEATLRGLFETGERVPRPPAPVTPALARRAGAFVGLHEGAHLRGCIGHRCGRLPLAEAIPELTLSAALDDTRFAPLTAALPRLGVEISVLTPLRRIAGPSCFEPGRHGLYLERGPCRALLLPQVARHRGWSREEFLAALARKAGIEARGWPGPAVRIYAFEAQVFSRQARLTASA